MPDVVCRASYDMPEGMAAIVGTVDGRTVLVVNATMSVADVAAAVGELLAHRCAAMASAA